ncbi:MAG TPA: hypothetical protein DCS07_17780, partial [Bdellovibrionales bacterium]|nr:hypothetical protein [Bdellovibrionales bacterium]
MFRSQWWKHGFLNLLEHGITRAGDALASLLLIWVLAPEVFARLALAQAWIAPLLFFFVAPEVVLYREYASWRAEGRQVFGKRLYALRIFGYWKIPAAILLSLAISLLMPATAESTQGDTFWSLLL